MVGGWSRLVEDTLGVGHGYWRWVVAGGAEGGGDGDRNEGRCAEGGKVHGDEGGDEDDGDDEGDVGDGD